MDAEIFASGRKTLETGRRTALLLLVAASAAVGLLSPRPVAAGCGCQKPPPDPASVRPNATYAGTPVSLFDTRFVTGRTYTVDFISGTTSSSATLTTTAVARRDLADGVVKPQLVVSLPNLPLGPTSIRVKHGSSTLFTLSDSAFTVVQAPVAVPEAVGGTSYPNYRAAIGRDGTFYISLDMSAVTLPRVFRAQAQGYPLVFASDGVTFYNIQGFLMQLLSADMPGLYSVISSASSTNSSILGYSRHEFNTFYLQHAERQVHEVLDGNWHIDGTRHVDHDHLILAISGTLYNGTAPVPGTTAPFTLRLERSSLFHHGLVATGSAANAATMGGNSETDGFDSSTGTYGQATGDVFTNGTLAMSNNAILHGDATATAFVLANQSKITGNQTPLYQPEAFLQVKMPDFLTDLGAISLSGSQTRSVGVGSYRVSNLSMSNTSVLLVDNCAGPVTLYVTGAIDIGGGARISTCSASPEQFAVYVNGSGTVAVGGNNGSFYGVLYAPSSPVLMSNSGDLYGAVVGGSLSLGNSSRLHYDTALRGRQTLLGGMMMFPGMEKGSAVLDTGGAYGGATTVVNPDALYEAPQL